MDLNKEKLAIIEMHEMGYMSDEEYALQIKDINLQIEKEKNELLALFREGAKKEDEA